MQRKEKIPNCLAFESQRRSCKICTQIWNTGGNCTVSWKISVVQLKTYVINWKRKFSNSKKEVGESPEKFNKSRPLFVREEFLLKIKESIIEIRLTWAVISRKMVISIGNAVLKANEPNSLSEFGDEIMLADN